MIVGPFTGNGQRKLHRPDAAGRCSGEEHAARVGHRNAAEHNVWRFHGPQNLQHVHSHSAADARHVNTGVYFAIKAQRGKKILQV